MQFPREALTPGSGETMLLRPRQGAQLVAWASGQPAAARSPGLRRKVPPLARLGVHSRPSGAVGRVSETGCVTRWREEAS